MRNTYFSKSNYKYGMILHLLIAGLIKPKREAVNVTLIG